MENYYEETSRVEEFLLEVSSWKEGGRSLTKLT